MVGLADAAEIAGDGLGSAQVDVGAVGTLGVEGLHVARADDLHGRRHRHDVSVVGLLLDHFAYPDESARHQLALLNAVFGLGDQPGEILQRADLKRHGILLIQHRRRPLGLPDVVRHGDEGLLVPLFDEPREVLDVGRLRLLEARHEALQLDGLGRFAVDLLRPAVALDHFEKLGDRLVLGVDQQRVDFIQALGRNLKKLLQICHNPLLLGLWINTHLFKFGIVRIHFLPRFTSR